MSNRTASGAEKTIIFIGNTHEKFCCEKFWRTRAMLKVRLMGTKNDIKWFEKILKRQPKVVVTEFSELYRNKGTDRFYRAYAEVHKANVKED